MKYISALLFLLFTATLANAQSYVVKGTVADTLNGNMLHRASVVLMRAKDTVIEAYTHAGPDGKFEMSVPKEGKYFLRITFPSFADYFEVLNIKKTTTDMGLLPMVSKEHLLKEFVLTQQIAAIKIKGDTTEYMADSFKVKEGSTVEDLLKKLPGIQVDKNGQITAQGETVQKILVDGEEFFSDDPKVVTKGLQANAVEKVQVYNKKSDQAEFTGIDDGQKTKTINLELKEDKKKGYFGKIDAGGGTDGYFQDQGMINAFKGKRQFSAFGIMSNTDKVGLGWEDNNKFGSGNTTMITDDGIFSFSSSSDDEFGSATARYDGEGLPHTWTGGAHFADKWKEDKNHVTGNYRYGMQNLELDGSTTTQNVLPGNKGFVTHQVKDQFSKGDRHGLDMSYEWKIDSNTTLKLSADGGYKQSDMYTHYNTHTDNQDSALLNKNDRIVKNFSSGDYVNADLVLKKKFRKKGRTLSLDFKENYKVTSSNGTLGSTTDVYLGPLDSMSRIDQKKTTSTSTLAFSGNATYTEPLSKVAYLVLNYGATLNNSTSGNSSFNLASPGHYSDVLDTAFSSNYKYDVFSNKGGASLKFVFKKVTMSVGGNISNTSYMQKDMLRKDSSRNYSYLNYYPNASFNYKISKQTSLGFNYYGNTQQPTIAEIQPLNQNSDPLNFTIGNPHLKQEFHNNFSLNFNDYKMMSGRYLYGNFSFNAIQDAITTKQYNINGVSRTSYFNVNGNYNSWGYFGGGMKLTKLKVYVGLQLNSSLNHVNNLVVTDSASWASNKPNNTTNYNSYSFGPYVNYELEKKFECSYRTNISYNDNKSTISNFSSSYYAWNNYFDITVQLPWNCEISSDVDYMIREKTPTFQTNNNVIKWNASVSKKMLKNKQLQVKASVLDILNQNIGYSRTSQAGTIVENNYNTIRRYGMLQLIWNFTHTPAGVKPAVDGPMMIIN